MDCAARRGVVFVQLLVFAVGLYLAAGAASRAIASSAALQVHATVAPCLCATFTESGVGIRANAHWELRAELPGGHTFVAVGGPTSWHEVTLPAGAASVAVSLP